MCWTYFVYTVSCHKCNNNTWFLLLAQARHILSSVQDFTSTQDSSTTASEEINYLTLENKSLQNHLVEQQQQYSEKMNEVVSELNNTRKEMVSHAPPISFCSLIGWKHCFDFTQWRGILQSALPFSCYWTTALGLLTGFPHLGNSGLTL